MSGRWNISPAKFGEELEQGLTNISGLSMGALEWRVNNWLKIGSHLK